VTSTESQGQPGGLFVLDRLHKEGRVTAAHYDSFYQRAKRTGERIEEIILESGLVSEAELLKSIASLHKTRFVSTERLSKADIDRSTLDLVPRRIAEQLQCVPIVFDRPTQTLSVVAYDLGEHLTGPISTASGVREIRVFAARPAAVKAALRRFYGGDRHAFTQLQARPIRTLDLAEPSPGTPPLPAGPLQKSPDPSPGIDFDDRTPALGLFPGRDTPGNPKQNELTFDFSSFEIAPTFESYLETLNVFVTLLDAGRGELRGHSSHVARISALMADRLTLSPADKGALLVAAYLHDVGKTSTYHLTALNVSREGGHRLQAQRSHMTPARMFESAHLPQASADILNHLYERYDGQGFPDRLARAEIPLGSRIIALVETYADLTVNSKNPYRRTLTRREALDVLRQLSSQLFDPALVDVLRQVVVGAETVAHGVARTRVLIVDPDREDTILLELRLAEAGHQVKVARDRAEALRVVAEQRFDLIILEVELGAEDGFAVRTALSADPQTKDIPVVFLTRKADRSSVGRGFELGASDYIVKPASPELVVAKTAHLIEAGVKQKSGGLAGSLSDVALPDVIQVLSNGRKTGLLRVTSGAVTGEIHFFEGQMANAKFGAHAREEAIYAMLALKDGDFSFDSTFEPTDRPITASTETLLLEGMRRMDEAGIS
jgi:response regulator RpfG family c-di-GMP phosphodiesterase